MDKNIPPMKGELVKCGLCWHELKYTTHNNPPLTFKHKAFQRFASGSGVIGNITINTIMRIYVRRKKMNHLLSVCCHQ
jgi:hypothetical protein